MTDWRITRRGWLLRAGATLAAGIVAGCDRVAQTAGFGHASDAAEKLTAAAQSVLPPRAALAPEFPAAAVAKEFRANGSTDPQDPAYLRHVAESFTHWKLAIGGLVEEPLLLSLADLQAAPSRSQITRHDCVEGWSAIAQWRGARLSELLKRARLKREARFLVFYCADDWEPDFIGTGRYYESIDLVDAFHPQTILAYEMNGQPLPVKHGAPIRLRVERQLGYKMAKYVMRIDAVAQFESIEGGRGGYWEDRGYTWYAGI
jgi:DMSO/TMAO reductase YedYZ molybdopterin-dependent catalytic subunit